jgi:hypothetical protein
VTITNQTGLSTYGEKIRRPAKKTTHTKPTTEACSRWKARVSLNARTFSPSHLNRKHEGQTHGYGTLFASSRNDDPDYAQTNIHMSITEKKLELATPFATLCSIVSLMLSYTTGSTSFHHRMEIGKPEYAPDPLHRQHQCWIPQLRRDHLGHARPHLLPHHRNLRGKQHALQLLSRVHLVFLYLHYDVNDFSGQRSW